jgi:hypothetical protein
MTSQLKVSDVAHEKLKTLKTTLGARSIDAVILHLLERSPIAPEEPPADGLDARDGDGPGRRRRIDVREPLYSLDMLDARRGMLEFYTGFDRPTVDLLIRLIAEASLRVDFCRSSLMRCHTHIRLTLY